MAISSLAAPAPKAPSVLAAPEALAIAALGRLQSVPSCHPPALANFLHSGRS